MSVRFPIELKTGFFGVEPCMMKIDSKASQLIIEFDKNADAYLIEFANIKKVIYNPTMHHEIEIQTDHNAYVVNIQKDEIQRGVMDFVKVSFGEKFKEIRY